MKKILVVAAHPDDEILGCGGSVAKLSKHGAEVHTLILGRGKTARGKIEDNEFNVLHKEIIAANRIIGVSDIQVLDFPDNSFDAVPLLSIIKAIEKIKNLFLPDIILTHHFGDINIDHRKTYEAVLTATRPMRSETVKEIYSFQIPSSTEWNSYCRNSAFIPNVFVDIHETIDLKIRAMEQYSSELREYPHPRSLQYIKDLAKLNGAQVGMKFSENFELVRQIKDSI